MKFIFGDKIARGIDKIWATKRLKYCGINDEILKKLNEVFFVLLIVHFEETLQDLTKIINTQELQYKLFRTSWDISNFNINRLAKAETKYAVLLSDILSELMRYDRFSRQTDMKGKKIHIVGAERYPIPERDNTILLYAAQLSQFTTVSFHAALDEPMMRLFGSDSITGLVKKLGWNEKTFIAHPMITKAINDIQRKIKRQSIGDQSVHSQEEWFYYNCPQSRDRLR
jgi:preprotein translocase subunit SecA